MKPPITIGRARVPANWRALGARERDHAGCDERCHNDEVRTDVTPTPTSGYLGVESGSCPIPAKRYSGKDVTMASTTAVHVRRLTRTHDGLTGVGGGIAEYVGIDPVWGRVGIIAG